jgi:hypothetical protein
VIGIDDYFRFLFRRAREGASINDLKLYWLPCFVPLIVVAILDYFSVFSLQRRQDFLLFGFVGVLFLLIVAGFASIQGVRARRMDEKWGKLK